jgi:hypothetical protein
LKESSTCSGDLFFVVLCCASRTEQPGTTSDGSTANVSSCDYV